ncbi:MAG: RelA/SpoT family protein, partial [Armatimonadota bacterium]
AHPKPNMYKSLHTKVIGPRGEPLEIQIRTFEMHRIADFGVAAHWRYKEGGGRPDTFEQKLSWLRQQMFDWSSESRDAGEFLRTVTDDLFADQVFVFTPKGRVIDLPAGSTPVDFAYRVHSEIGHTCVGAKVNGRIVPLNYVLKNGDVVEIFHRPGASPSFDWLTFVKSAHARGKIKAWFRKLRRQENVVRGRELLEREAHRLRLSPADVLRDEELKRVAPTFNLAEPEDLMAAVGAGTIAPSTVLKRLREPAQKQPTLPEVALPSGDGKLNIAPGGVDQILVRRSRCCLPLPGDEVCGYVSRGRGMVLHRSNCRNLQVHLEKEPERVLDVHWPSGGGDKFHSRIKVEAMDRVGLLNDVSAVFSENHVNIRAARVLPQSDRTTNLDLTVDVTDVQQLQSLMVNVSKVPDVLRVYRVGSYQRKANGGGES